LADVSASIAIIGSLGEPSFDAVTSSLNINFLAKPEADGMTASFKLLRVGRRMAVGEAELYSEAVPDGRPRHRQLRATVANLTVK